MCMCAGYFTFKPKSCSTPGCPGQFQAGPCRLQDLDYITRGEHTQLSHARPRCLGHAIQPNAVCVADGVILMKRAAYACTCGAVVWQAPIDFLGVGAWPASLDANHLRTVVDTALLQLYDSQRLFCPGLSMAGFLKGVADAAHKCRPSQVALHGLLCSPACTVLAVGRELMHRTCKVASSLQM